jgi:hypothetical protein
MSHAKDAQVYDAAKIALLRHAVEHNPRSARLMFKLADLLAECGEFHEYARIFAFAYKLKPSDQSLRYLSADDARALRNKAQALIERGVNYSSVVAALAISSALLEDRSTVARLIDYRRLFSLDLAVRPKEFSRSDFFAALSAEIKSNLRFYDASDRAIQKAWRHNNIFSSDSPVCRALVTEVRAHLDRYLRNCRLTQAIHSSPRGRRNSGLRPGQSFHAARAIIDRISTRERGRAACITSLVRRCLEKSIRIGGG